MKHGITELEWSDYLDGCSSDADRDRIESHLTGCLECWEFYEKLSSASEELVAAGEEARHGMMIEDRHLHVLLRGVFDRLDEDDSGAGPRNRVEGRLNQLNGVLVPFCGSQAAALALETAARNSPARSIERLNPDNWEPFLKKLTSIAGMMCGETFASLVWERGQF